MCITYWYTRIRILYHVYTSCHHHIIYNAYIYASDTNICICIQVVQKLVPQLPTLNNLLDLLIFRSVLLNICVHVCTEYAYIIHICMYYISRYKSLIYDFNILILHVSCAYVYSCNIEKSYLVDVRTKLYIATDSSPVDLHTYELCADLIDVVIDVSWIYGLKPAAGKHGSTKHNGTCECIYMLYILVLSVYSISLLLYTPIFTLICNIYTHISHIHHCLSLTLLVPDLNST